MEKDEAPSRSVERDAGAGSVRERTLAHMESLLRTATSTLGTGLLLACGAQAQKPRPPQVCDPLGSPADLTCAYPDQFFERDCIRSFAGWVNSGGQWSLRLTLDAVFKGSVSFAGPFTEDAGKPPVRWGLTKEDTKVSGASLKDLKTQPKQVALELVPALDAKQVTLEFPVLWGGRKLLLKLALDTSTPPTGDHPVPVNQVK